VQIEVKPELEPQNYTGLDVEAPEVKPTEDMVNQRIEEMRQQNATYEEVDRELKPEDGAVFDIKVVDSKGHTVEQKTNEFMENPHDTLPHELAHEVVGKKAGDTIEAKVPGKGGEQLRYTVQLKSVKELRLPSLDDEFAKDAGFENQAAMRASVQEGINSFLKDMNEDSAFDALVSKLIEAHSFDVPPTLKASIENDLMRSDVNYMYSTGMLPPRSRGLSRKEYRDKIEKDAETRVKGFLLVDAIGRKENITASEEDINAALEDKARQEGRKAVAIRAALERRREFDQFVEQVRFNKIRRYLLDNSKVTYVEAPAEEAKPEEGAPSES
jgi:trigger factor